MMIATRLFVCVCLSFASVSVWLNVICFMFFFSMVLKMCVCVWIHIGLHLGMSGLFVFNSFLHYYNSFYYFNSSVELQGPSKPPHVLSLTDRWLRIGENSCVSSTDGSRSSIEFGVIGLGVVVRMGLFIGQDITSPMMMFGLIFCNCCCSWSRLRCFFISCRSSFWWISCSNRRML